MRFVQLARKVRRHASLQSHPAIAAALFFNIAAWPSATSQHDIMKRPAHPVLNAPVESIAWSGVRNDALSVEDAQVLMSSSKDEAMNWQYMYLPREVEGYYRDFEAAIARDCKGVLARCPAHLQEYGVTLYKGFRLSPEYRAWDRARREEFLRLVANDPVLVQARTYWNVSRKSPHHINLGQRRDIARHVIALYTQVYAEGRSDFDIPRLVTMDLHRDIDGQYVHDPYKKAATPEIRMRAGDLLWRPFNRVMSILVHEARHNVQRNLGWLSRSEEGMAYLQKKGIAREVRIFALIQGPGRPVFTSVKDEGYRISPVEKEAYAHQGDGEKIGIGDVPQTVLYADLDDADRTIEAQRKEAADKFGFSRYVRSTAPRGPLL